MTELGLFILARPDVLAFSGVCLVIFSVMWYAKYAATKQWIDTVLSRAAGSINEVQVYPMSQMEFDIHGPGMDYYIHESHEVVNTDEYQFVVPGIGGKSIRWEMNIPHNHFDTASLHVGTARQSRRIALEYKDRLKEISLEAHTMWKLTQGL